MKIALLSLLLTGCGATPVNYEPDSGAEICPFEGEDGAQFAESTVNWIPPKCLPDGGFYQP